MTEPLSIFKPDERVQLLSHNGKNYLPVEFVNKLARDRKFLVQQLAARDGIWIDKNGNRTPIIKLSDEHLKNIYEVLAAPEKFTTTAHLVPIYLPQIRAEYVTRSWIGKLRETNVIKQAREADAVRDAYVEQTLSNRTLPNRDHQRYEIHISRKEFNELSKQVGHLASIIHGVRKRARA